MNSEIRAAIAAHAIAEYPRECCGLVLLVQGKEEYVPCKNAAAVPTDNFVILAEAYADAEDRGEVIALAHSHPGAPARPSMADKTMCEASGIATWLICSVGVQADGTVGVSDWCEFGPSGYVAPLIGRDFAHGTLDCYSLVRDWYRMERGIVLLDGDRPDGWWDDGVSNLYMDNFSRAGFIDLGQRAMPEIGDVLLMQIRSKNGVPNHAGIYIGNNQILHHMYGRLSCRAVWGGMWAQSLRTVLRYEGKRDE